MADHPSKTGSSREDGDRPEVATTLSGCFVRLMWLVVGNMALVLLTVLILREPPWRFTIKDGLFWILVAGLVVLRYVDVTRFAGSTADGERATTHHVRRYAAGLLVLSIALWAGAHSTQV